MFEKTHIEGLVVVTPKIWGDDRGYFYESYNEKLFKANGIEADFVQDNQAFSSFGVLRGLHFQTGEFAQAKLVRVIQGEVLDVAVDLRKDSKTYGEWFSIHLSGENHKQLFVPRGFAHGYVVLSDTALFSYKCDNFYSKDHEAGIMYNDPTLKIDWEINCKDMILSEKDKKQEMFGG